LVAVALLPAASLLGSLTVEGCGPSRDTVEKSVDVHVTPPQEDYVYVANGAHASVALAEARDVPEPDAKRYVDAWTNSLETCVAQLETQGQLHDGTARIVIVLDASGQIAGTNVKFSEGTGALATALECLLVPIKATPFPPSRTDAGSRGIAIEARWHGSGSR
jgi:hypothetical protein